MYRSLIPVQFSYVNSCIIILLLFSGTQKKPAKLNQLQVAQ